MWPGPSKQFAIAPAVMKLDEAIVIWVTGWWQDSTGVAPGNFSSTWVNAGARSEMSVCILVAVDQNTFCPHLLFNDNADKHCCACTWKNTCKWNVNRNLLYSWMKCPCSEMTASCNWYKTCKIIFSRFYQLNFSGVIFYSYVFSRIVWYVSLSL